MDQTRSHSLYMLGIIEQNLPFEEKASHAKCKCYHCLNNTKPCIRLKPQRITSQKERILGSCEAFDFVIRKMATFQFSGRVLAPQVYFVRDSILVSSVKGGRIRLKQNQANIDVKKHFQEQRRKITNSQLNFLTNSLLTMSIQTTNLSGKVSKQMAILNYNDGSEQILSESTFGKMLSKRKNDPIWDDISHVLLIPPETQNHLQKVRYYYQRNSDTVQIITPIMEIVSKDLDANQERTNKTENRFGSEQSSVSVGFERSMLHSTTYRLANRSSSSNAKRNINSGTSNSLEVPSQEQIERASMEVVAFIELTCEVRILQADFEYIVVHSRLYLTNIKSCICAQLQPHQLTQIHDRFKLLEQDKLQQISACKRNYDQDEEQHLWNICAGVMSECLDMRKIELKLTDYHKPNDDTLVNIFLRLFPTFQAEQVFSSVTWKQELHSFFEDKKREVYKMIRQDEGIRILRRFGIHFRRTFD